MPGRVPYRELADRVGRFRDQMDRDRPGWEMAAFFGTVNLYYFTGTMQNGVLLLPRSGDPVFWVRRSYDRAHEESAFPDIRPMRSYRDAAKGTDTLPDTIYLEAEIVPLALIERFRKHFPFRNTGSLDMAIARVRSVKSPFEWSLMEHAGRIHRHVLEDCVPGMLRAGESEAEFGGELYALMVRSGHQGIVRFGMFNTEIEVGQIGFGESSLYPTSFDGPGGCRGIGPASPVLGSPGQMLAQGDLVFIDNACGVDGYQTDKTMTYMFGRPLPDDAIEMHHICVEIEHEMASLLRPGKRPGEIYTEIMDGLSPGFGEHFMGFGARKAGFLGHGTGLEVDELPVIARGFDDPLREGMCIALEPKRGVPGVGMVGTENTYLVTPGGGRSITGSNPGLIPVF
jgi:Xaa-Pro dipeptidase